MINAIMIIGTLLCCAAMFVFFGGIIADSNAACGIATIMLVVGFVMVLCGGFIMEKEPKPQLYPLTTKVVELDRENDVVTCEDFNGNLWEFEGCEDWQDGDICSLLMNNKGTEKIYDDEIVLAQYNGTFEGWN